MIPWRVFITARGMSAAGDEAVAALRATGCEVVISPKWGPLRENELKLEEAASGNFDAALASTDFYTPRRPGLANTVPAQNHFPLGRGLRFHQSPRRDRRRNLCHLHARGCLERGGGGLRVRASLRLGARRVHVAHLRLMEEATEPQWGNDIFGKTLGIIGCGRIGLAVARRAAGFQMQALGFDPKASPEGRATRCQVCFLAGTARAGVISFRSTPP